MKVKISWNGQGGELDSIVVNVAEDNDDAIRKALVKLIGSGIVAVGDSFTVEQL